MFSNQQHYLQPPGLLCKLLQKWARKVVSVFAVTQRQCEFLAAAWAPEGSAHLLGGASRQQHGAASYVRERMGAITCVVVRTACWPAISRCIAEYLLMHRELKDKITNASWYHISKTNIIYMVKLNQLVKFFFFTMVHVHQATTP